MIKKFEQYNEGLSDKMTPKDLHPMAEMFHGAVKDIENLGYKVKDLQAKDGRYEFMFLDEYDEYDTIYVNVVYSDKETILKNLKPGIIYGGPDGWSGEIYHGETKESHTKEADSWIVLLNEIIDDIYPYIESAIHDTEKAIKDRKNHLKRLKKLQDIQNNFLNND